MTSNADKPSLPALSQPLPLFLHLAGLILYNFAWMMSLSWSLSHPELSLCPFVSLSQTSAWTVMSHACELELTIISSLSLNSDASLPFLLTGFSLDLDEPSQSARSGKSSGKKEKKEKKEKRPPNDYNKYVSEQMKVLRKKHPGTPSTDLFKQISQNWKTSSK
jgi:hypothetical protein